MFLIAGPWQHRPRVHNRSHHLCRSESNFLLDRESRLPFFNSPLPYLSNEKDFSLEKMPLQRTKRRAPGAPFCCARGRPLRKGAIGATLPRTSSSSEQLSFAGGKV